MQIDARRGAKIPYIDKGVRQSLDEGRKATKPGELNYQMSQLVKSYMAMKGLSYTTLNDIAGVLACLQMEVYRRISAPYEDQKLIDNGEALK